jgi:hypothetical protein
MKVKYTELAIASGKLNGMVHARNKGGNYIRKWSKPLNPKTDLQLAVRNSLTTLSREWGALTEAKRVSWIALASNIVRKNRIGESVSLSGNALYNEFNGNLATLGVASLDTAPAFTAPELPSIGSLIVKAAVFTYDLPAIAATQYFVICVTPQVSAGKTNIANKLRVLEVVQGTAAIIHQNSLASYTAKFGVPVVGKKIQISVKVINGEYPISTSPITETATVAAP